jgi:hypothetical protein
MGLLVRGTAAYKRTRDQIDWTMVDPHEPDVLTVYEGPMPGLEIAVGMMTRHANDLGIDSLLILFPPPDRPASPRRLRSRG